MKKLLFISWDSDSSNYLESLFFPILNGLASRNLIVPYVLQFSWADQEEVRRISLLAQMQGIDYFHQSISRNSPHILSSLVALVKGRKLMESLVKKKQINLLMPRSTMPALLVNSISGKLGPDVQIVFDADGLPIQERIDYTGMKEDGLMHRLLLRIESRMLLRADKVFTRTEKSIAFHLMRLPHLDSRKFFKVENGRDIRSFNISNPDFSLREKLGISPDDILMVHSGTLGSGYAVSQMFFLLKTLLSHGVKAKLLFLTRAGEYARQLIPEGLASQVRIIESDFSQVPEWLKIADMGICLRKQAPSLIGISPIKLGEYLLCGLPVVLSTGIGDAGELLDQQDLCHWVGDEIDGKAFVNWAAKLGAMDRVRIADFAKKNYSLEKSIDLYQKALLK